jgi:hypothetical protein
MVLRAILAAVLGTVAMTLSSTTEQQLVGREPSVVPGLATAKLLRPLGVREVKGRALDILSTWTHWVFGTLWGFVFWALIDPIGLPLAGAGVIFFLLVWGAQQVQLPVLGLTPWPWRWGVRAYALDAFHHIVYAVGTVVGWALLGRVA